jgi:histidyl-tRNA synthetase
VLPYRSYRVGWVFRNEKPGPGRFRQFMQFDADTVGSSSPAADAEMCMMAADTMEALGIPRGSYVVKVSNRKVLDALLEDVDLGGELNATRRLTVLRAIDKKDRLGVEGVRALLGKGRKDESGDFTKGADLSPQATQRIIDFISGEGTVWADVTQYNAPTDDELTIDGPALAKITNLAVQPNDRFFYFNSRKLTQWFDIVGKTKVGDEAVSELRKILTLMEAAGYGSQRFQISGETVRGLEYYTGPVFEVELTFPTDGKDGSPRFGSVGGGGRYDGLVSRFRGEPVPATGFSIGVSRLAAALEYLGKLDSKPGYGPVVVTVFDRDRLADYQNMVAKLRAANIRAELYLGNPKNLGNQLKYADRRNSPCVVIQGSDEKAKGEVTIKDLIVGAELAKLEKGRDAHLQKQAQAQRSVPEAKLVDTVRHILESHGVT